MDQSTALLSHWLQPIAESLGVPLLALMLGAFLLIGVFGHLILGILLARLNRATENSANPWDNVIASALVKPGEWLMWLVLLYLSLGLLEGAEDLRGWVRQAADTGLILILGWFAQRVLAGVESELLGEHRGPRDSDARATISATIRLLRITLW
ncbi:MAG: mechanosensitive ion channel family protein, partial [Halieaceae bacterium]